VRGFEIHLEKLNRKDPQDLKEEPRSILSSRSLRSSWFIILVLTATSSSSDGTAELFHISPPEEVVYLNGIRTSTWHRFSPEAFVAFADHALHSHDDLANLLV